MFGSRVSSATHFTIMARASAFASIALVGAVRLNFVDRQVALVWIGAATASDVLKALGRWRLRPMPQYIEHMLPVILTIVFGIFRPSTGLTKDKP